MTKGLLVPAAAILVLACVVGLSNGCSGEDNSARVPQPAGAGTSWLSNGAVFMEDFKPVRTFGDLKAMSLELKDIGIATIEMLPFWDHPSYWTRDASHFVRWEVRDYSKLDPERGSERDLSDFITAAHALGLKVVPCLPMTTAFPPTPVGWERIIPGYRLYYDTDGIGGHFYRHQMQHPDKEILLRNLRGDFACTPLGFGFAVNQDSKDFIELVVGIYGDQILRRNFDGIRLDANVVNNSVEGETLDFGGTTYTTLDPVARRHSPLPLFRALRQASTSDQVFIAEHTTTELMFYDYQVRYPYYSSNPDVDEVADATEGYEFQKFLKFRIIDNGATSAELVEWINSQPIQPGRHRFRMIRNWNHTAKMVLEFVANDAAYYPSVILAATIPGIPKVSDYELFGLDYADAYYGLTPTNLPQQRRECWKRILSVRNNSGALKHGDIRNIWEAGDMTYAYSRTHQGETVAVVVNFADRAATSRISLPFKRGDVLEDRMTGQVLGVVGEPGEFEATVPAHGARVLGLRGK